MDEAVIATFDDVKFIEGVTFLTQQNWQEYFSPVIKNGVVDGGLEPRNYVGSTTYSNGRVFVTDGFVFANGICAKIETPTGYTDFGTVPSGKKDRLICVRVYFDSNTAQFIEKTDVMEIPESQTIYSDTYKLYSAYTMDLLAHDESYLMERNTNYWDIPIFYQGASNLEYTSKGLDLRRVINKTRQNDPENTVFKGTANNKLKISGNNFYHIKVVGDNEQYLICSDPIDLPDGAIIILDRTNETLYSHRTRLQISYAAATNNNLASSSFDYQGTYPAIQMNDNYIDITDTGVFCIQFTYVGTKGTYEINNRTACYPFDIHTQILPN